MKKSVWFSEAEWLEVEQRMAASRISGFGSFARVMCLNGEVRVDEHKLDVSRLLAELAPIGNNVNQIARKVNADNAVSMAQLDAVMKLLRQVQDAIRRGEVER